MTTTPMVRVEYVGKKDTRVDTIANTGTVWFGAGDVREVPAEAWARLSRHPDVWRLADEQPAASQQEQEPPVGLLGTDKMPSLVDIAEGRQAQLGDIVRGAFAESGATVEEWNSLDPAERDELIAVHLEAVRKAFNSNDPPPPPPTKGKAKGKA